MKPAILTFLFIGCLLDHALTYANDLILSDANPAHREIRDPNFDLIVGTVVELISHESTNANPPIVKLNVEEVLRGISGTDSLIVQWVSPPPKPSDYVVQPNASSKWVLKEEWLNAVMIGPPIGAKIIMATFPTPPGDTNNPGVVAKVVVAYAYTNYNIEVVRKNMFPRRSWLVTAFFSILASPVISLLSICCLSRTSSFKIASTFCVLSIGAYIYYESGISPYDNIRVDLLLIFPALLLSIVLWYIAGFRIPQSKE